MTTWMIFACILVWGLTPLTWFRADHLITTTDLFLPTPPADWISQLFVWNPRFGTGAEYMTGPSALISNGLTAAVIAVGGSERLAQQVEFVVWFLLPGLTMWWFLRQLLPGRRHWVTHLVAVNVYMFNLFLEAMWAGNKAGLSGYVVLPLLLGILYRALETRRWVTHAAAFALASILGSGASVNPQVTVVMVLAVLVFLICYAVARLRGRRAFLELAGFLALTTLLTVGCHAFWLMPQIVLARDPVTVNSLRAFAKETHSWLSGVSASTSAYNVARLQGAWTWYQGWYEPYATYSQLFRENPVFIMLSWVWLGFVALGVAASRRWIDGFFILMAAIGVAFGMGLHSPMGPVYRWCIDHVPLFGLIRGPWYKFTLLTCLGYAYLMGRAAHIIWDWCRARVAAVPAWNERQRGFAAGLPAAAIIGIVGLNMVYALPVTTGRMYPTAAERQKLKPCHVDVPDYVGEAGRWFDAQPGWFRVFYVPKHTNGISVYRWGFVGIPPVLYHTSTRPLLFNTMPLAFQESGNQLVTVLYQALYDGTTNQLGILTRMLGARYLIQENDLDHDYFEEDGDTPQFMAMLLASQDGLAKDRAFGPWQLYRIADDTPPHAFSARSATVVDGGAGTLAHVANAGWLPQEPLVVFRDQVKDAAIAALTAHGFIDRLCILNRQVETADPLAAAVQRLLVVQETTSAETSIEPDTMYPDTMVHVQVLPTWFTTSAGEDGVPWLWMRAGGTWQDRHLIIENRTGQPITTHFQLVVQSEGLDRNLFFYINDTLVAHPTVPQGVPRTLLIDKVQLQPGRNTIRFYSPYAWTSRTDGTSVSFAFRPDAFRFGRLRYRGTLVVPRADTYRVSLWRYGMQRTADGAKILRLGDQQLTLTPRRTARRAWGPAPVPLPAGVYPYEISQGADGDQFAVVLEAGPTDTGPPPAGVPLPLQTVDPTVHVGTWPLDAPGVVIFNESFSPRWQLVDAGTGRPVADAHWMVNGFANGFWITRPGTYRVRLEYQGQAAARQGWRLTAWAVGFCVILIGGAWMRRR